MLKVRPLPGLVGIAALFLVLMGTQAGTVETASLVPVKLGLSSLSKQEAANFWKRVDSYATVDAVHEFCGKSLNLRIRAWKAVGTCIERTAFQKVLRVFRAKKAKYKKAWEDMHVEPERREQVCEVLKPKLNDYARIISGEISEAASLCRSCLFC